MKKTILISFVAVVAFSACKKDRTCTCSYYAPNGSLYVEETKYFKVKKKQAEARCLDYQTTTQINGVISYGSKVGCTLK